MQFQADLLGIQVVCENIPEASGVGMAYFGGLACGFYASIEELAQLSTSQRIYEPTWMKIRGNGTTGAGKRPSANRAASYSMPIVA